MDLHSRTPEQLRARATMKWTTYPPDVLPMWVAEMDFPVCRAITDALHTAVDAETLGYPAVPQMAAVGQACAQWSAETLGWAVDPADVHVVGDVMHGVRLAIEYYTGPEDPVLIPSPVYMPFFDIVELTRRPQVRVPLRRADGGEHVRSDSGTGEGAGQQRGRWELDLPAIDAALAAGARTVLLCNPHNPLGRVFEAAELAALAEVVDRHGARVISDEIHAPLGLTRRCTPYAAASPAAARQAITVTSASKAWNLPGLKCAQVITSAPGDTERWHRIPVWDKVGVSTLGMVGAQAAYRQGGDWLTEVTATVREHAELAAAAVATWPGVQTDPLEGTYLQWLDFGALGLTEEPADWLLREARVALNPGPPFGADRHRYARLNLATTRALLEQGLERIGRAVQAVSR